MSPYPVPCVVPSSRQVNPEVPPSVLRPRLKGCGTILGHAPPDGPMDQERVLDGGWLQDINGMLNFNKAFVTKGMIKHVHDE